MISLEDKLDPKERWKDLRTREKLLAANVAVFSAFILLHFVFGRHQMPAYDTYTYISFAEHYSEHWFRTVIADQAHGLQIASYPPLIFQVMALLSFIPLLDMQVVYLLMMSAGVAGVSTTFYLLCSDLMGFKPGKKMSVFFLTAFSTGVLKFSLVHGQLTFIWGMTAGFLATYYFRRCIEGGSCGPQLAATLALTAYIHHFSLLMTGILVVVLSLLELRKLAERINYLLPPLALSGLLAALGLYPVIIETVFGISQGVIFHGSRQPFRDLKIFHQFVTSTFGLSAAALALIIAGKDIKRKITVPALVFLTIGLGLATPTPRIFFGSMSTFLVYDRFSVIASMFLTAILAGYLSDLNSYWKKIDVGKAALLLVVLVSLGSTFWANSLHLGAPTGYGAYDQERTQKTIDYLEQNASEDYLYATYDHFPPTAEITRNTDVPSLDTGYFQGRKHGILEGEGKFDRISPEKFKEVIDSADSVSLKYVFVYNGQYNYMFSDTEWEKQQLGDNMWVWVNQDVDRYEPDRGEKRYLFGSMPLLVLALTVLVIVSGMARNRLDQLMSRAGSMIENADLSGERLALPAVLGLPLLAVLPSLITSGYPAGIDTPAHIFKPQLMAEMLREHGRIFRWTSEWYNGYPFLSMYPPLSTYLIFGLQTLLGDIKLAYDGVRALGMIALSGSVYMLAGKITDDRTVRTAGAAMAVFSYPIYSNMFTVGRLASALALPMYVFLIYLVLRPDVFQKELSRGQVYVAFTAAMIFMVHAMTAYMFIFTAVIFCLVYRDRIKQIGIEPVALMALLPLALNVPYIARLVQHFSVTDPTWFIKPRDFNPLRHLTRSFDLTVPNYLGWITAVLAGTGLYRGRIRDDKLLQFLGLNFGFFFAAFWARNFRSAFFIPLSGQFDLARFEIVYTVFAVMLAVYGLNYLKNEYLGDLPDRRAVLFTVCLIGLVVLDASPMMVQSAGWQPEFEDELDRIELDDRYRAIGVNMRKWHTYILWELDVRNAFGWFDQANPNPGFKKDLQSAGGRWYGEPVTYEDDPEYRKNLMEVSNTRYIVEAKGEWMNPALATQVLGSGSLNHPNNDELISEVASDPDFQRTHESEHLRIFSLQRNMSFCEGVEPVFIPEGSYDDRTAEMLRGDRMLPELPVRGEGSEADPATGVSCTRIDPYRINVSVREEGWVLVKESYYPFWERSGGGEIRNGYGFMVLRVDGDEQLRYRPRSLSTLQVSDLLSLFS